MSLSRLVYDIIIRVYAAGIRTISPFHAKAARWVRGRRHWRRKLQEGLGGRRADLWIHCASLGEFEQGRPVLEALRARHPGMVILLSFYSPSGYEIRQDYPHADAVTYLPLDTAANARDFLDIVRPRLALFIKYEFWLHFLTELHTRGIPVMLISAIFRPGQFFFRRGGKSFLRLLSFYEKIFVQDESAARVLEAHSISRVVVAGDTRFDRVLRVAADAREIPGVAAFAGDALTLVAGSTWPEDEALLGSALGSIPKCIIAPHEIHPLRLSQLEKRFGEDCVRYSALAADTVRYRDRRVLLIDNIGMLSSLYRYGRIAYIGGGFGHGIHNLLEAAVYGIPVIFGPRHQKFREARDLLALGAAASVENEAELREALARFRSGDAGRRAGEAAGAYVALHAGATTLATDFIQEKRFLTSA